MALGTAELALLGVCIGFGLAVGGAVAYVLLRRGGKP